MFSEENVVPVAIIATLAESAIGVTCCIVYILYYNCALLISSDHTTPVDIFGFVFYSSYVTSGNCTFKDGTPVALYNRNTKTKPNSILIWQTVYLVIYLLWIFSSFLLFKARKNPSLYMVPWIVVTSKMLILDLITSALTLTDLGVDTNDIFDDNFKEYHIGKFVALLMYCCKGGLVWFVNLGLLYLTLTTLKKMKTKEEKSPYWEDKDYNDIRRELSRKAADKFEQDNWNNMDSIEDDLHINSQQLGVPGQQNRNMFDPKPPNRQMENRGEFKREMNGVAKQQNRPLDHPRQPNGEQNGPKMLNSFLNYPQKFDRQMDFPEQINVELDFSKFSRQGDPPRQQNRGMGGQKQPNRQMNNPRQFDRRMSVPQQLNRQLDAPGQLNRGFDFQNRQQDNPKQQYRDGEGPRHPYRDGQKQLYGNEDGPKQLHRDFDFSQQLNKLLDHPEKMYRELDYSQQLKQEQDRLEELDVMNLPQQHRQSNQHYREPESRDQQQWESSSISGESRDNLRYNVPENRQVENINGNIYQRPQSFRDRVMEAKQNKETMLNMGGMFRYPTDTTKLRQGRRESLLPDQDVETAFDFLSKYEESGESKSRKISNISTAPNISVSGESEFSRRKRDFAFFIPRVRVPAGKLRISSFHKKGQKKQSPVKDKKTKYYVPLKK